MEASEYLRGKIIPEFVFKLDTLTVLPIDSRGLTTEMHLHGINMRYLSIPWRRWYTFLLTHTTFRHCLPADTASVRA